MRSRGCPATGRFKEARLRAAAEKGSDQIHVHLKKKHYIHVNVFITRFTLEKIYVTVKELLKSAGIILVYADLQ